MTPGVEQLLKELEECADKFHWRLNSCGGSWILRGVPKDDPQFCQICPLQAIAYNRRCDVILHSFPQTLNISRDDANAIITAADGWVVSDRELAKRLREICGVAACLTK